MRSATHNLNVSSTPNALGSAASKVKRGFDAAVITGSGIHLTSIPGAKTIVLAFQILFFARKTIVLVRSASHRLHTTNQFLRDGCTSLALKARRRCVAGSIATDNHQQPTTQE